MVKAWHWKAGLFIYRLSVSIGLGSGIFKLRC